jgi:redox-sensing transcriptional repressor
VESQEAGDYPRPFTVLKKHSPLPKTNIKSKRKGRKMKEANLPKRVVERLSVYLRYLEHLDHNGITSVSSQKIAENAGQSPVRVRKDLSYIGRLGVTGVGYEVSDLIKALRKAMGFKQQIPVVVFGSDSFSRALIRFWRVYERDFKVSAVFDVKPKEDRIDDQPVLDIRFMAEYIKLHDIKIGIVVTPDYGAQAAVNHMVNAGINGIIAFTPEAVRVPEGVLLKQIDLAAQLKVLAFELA